MWVVVIYDNQDHDYVESVEGPFESEEEAIQYRSDKHGTGIMLHDEDGIEYEYVPQAEVKKFNPPRT